MSELDGLKLLRRIEEGVAGKTGDAFFRQIVRDLSRALHAHGAFTSRLLPNRRAKMLAFWVGGAYETCLEYALEGTPCEFVYRGEITSYARNVGEVFPVDREWFAQMGVLSYLGIPVKDETGAVCGHLAVMDRVERDWADADVDVLRLFSLRSAAEIERTRYQHELETARVAAESANRAKSVFISQMSHELRTPLNGILGYVQLLKRDDHISQEKLRESVAVIERSGEHLLKLVNDLLDLARIEAGKLELTPARIDLCELLDHVASLTRVRAVNAGLTLDVSIDMAAFTPVVTDERVVRQILLNLLGNAVKFTERGGRVALYAQAERIDRQRLRVRFVVEDSGIGIEPAQLARIFEPFHRVTTGTRVVEGTGLGLTITQRLVAALKGELSVKSVPGVGTTFSVTSEFEIAAVPQGVALPVSEIQGYGGPTRSVLVADDDDDNRRLVVQLLESVGFLVQNVGNGHEALSRIRTVRPDLILTDLVMPTLDGMELVRAIRTNPALHAIPVVAMSASASDYTREEALQAGCSSFLPKPLKLADLLDSIGQQLQLEWRYREPPQARVPNGVADEAQPFRLQPDLAEELQHLAKQGDILALAARVDVALSAEPAARAFCAEMRELVSRYDIRGIRQMLTASRAN